MKSKQKLFILILVILGTLGLSACAGGVQSSSWPGVKLSDEVIYLTNNQHVYAVDPLNGTEVSRYPVDALRGASFYAPVAEDADKSFVLGGYNKILYRFQGNAYSELFKDAKNSFIASPIIDGDRIYAPNGDGKLYVLDRTGNLVNTFEANRGLWAAPLIEGNVIYQASMDHHLYCLDKNTLEVLWETDDLGGALVDAPTLGEDGILYVSTLGNNVIALDKQNGKELNRFDANQWVWSSPLLYEGRLYFGDLDGNFYTVDATTFNEINRIQPDTVDKRQILGKPLAFNSKIYFGSETGNLYTVDPESGNLLSTRTIGGKIYAGPVASGDLILVAPNGYDFPLVALDETGNQKWAFSPAK